MCSALPPFRISRAALAPAPSLAKASDGMWPNLWNSGRPFAPSSRRRRAGVGGPAQPGFQPPPGAGFQLRRRSGFQLLRRSGFQILRRSGFQLLRRSGFHRIRRTGFQPFPPLRFGPGRARAASCANPAPILRQSCVNPALGRCAGIAQVSRRLGAVSGAPRGRGAGGRWRAPRRPPARAGKRVYSQHARAQHAVSTQHARAQHAVRRNTPGRVLTACW